MAAGRQRRTRGHRDLRARTSGASTAPAEAAFHRLLDAADHSRTAGKSAGREWFLTHTRFLDEIARTLGLHINVINEGEFDNH